MGNGYEFDDPTSQARTDTDPAIPVPPVAWSDEPDEPERHEPPAPTPADERIKLGLAAASFIGMTGSLIAGKDLMAAAFGGIVTSIAAYYFDRRKP